MLKRSSKALAILVCISGCLNSASATESPANAIKNLSAQIRKDPANMDSRRKISAAFLKAGLAAKAEEQMMLVMRFGERSLDDHLLLADCQRYAGKQSDAIRSYQEVLSKDPGNTKAVSGLAYSYMLAGDSAAAARICKTELKKTTDINSKRELTATLSKLESTVSFAKLAASQEPALR